MKNSILILLLFVFVFANAQYTIDYANAPLNPLPLSLKYTTSHFGLKGNVKKLIVIKGFSDDAEYLFSEKGKLMEQKNDGLFGTGTDKIIYDKKGFILKKESAHGYSDSFETDKKGRITKYTSGLNGNSYTYHYNDKGFLAEIKDPKSQLSIIGYEYDDMGRLNKNNLYDANGKFVHDEEYSIIKNDGELEITHYFINNNTKQEDTKWLKFDKDGNEKKNYSYDTQGNIVGEYNYNKSKVFPRQVIEYY